LKLKAHQWLGIAAVIVFGGKLVYELTRPEPDPFYLPGALPMSDTLAGAGAVEFPMTALPDTSAITPPPLDPLIAGSDEARDDLYCSGLVYAAHRTMADELSPEAQARRVLIIALDEAGAAKLRAEGIVDPAQIVEIANAQGDAGFAEFEAGIARLSVADCEARIP